MASRCSPYSSGVPLGSAPRTFVEAPGRSPHSGRGTESLGELETLQSKAGALKSISWGPGVTRGIRVGCLGPGFTQQPSCSARMGKSSGNTPLIAWQQGLRSVSANVPRILSRGYREFPERQCLTVHNKVGLGRCEFYIYSQRPASILTCVFVCVGACAYAGCTNLSTLSAMLAECRVVPPWGL